MEKVECYGERPSARFGHTVTQISKTQSILFGGVFLQFQATGDTGRYSFTNDCFLFDCSYRSWKKLDVEGTLPCPRAAHASSAIEQNQIVVYSGATGGGQLAPDDLYLLDLRIEPASWTLVPIHGKTPGKRYGHSITYNRPYLVVIGGNTGSEPVNDVWILNVEKSPFQWQKIECLTAPIPRAYHSTVICSQGYANGMIVVFGGRGIDQSALNDTWGLRKHRDGKWDWVQAPYKTNVSQPEGRYQHSAIFMNSCMIIIGGRTNNANEMLPMEIYDTENSEWQRFSSIQRFRHATWISEAFLYCFGGFELDSPNIPTDQFQKINLSKLFEKNENLTRQLMLNTQNSSPSQQFKSNSGQNTPDINQKQQNYKQYQQVPTNQKMQIEQTKNYKKPTNDPEIQKKINVQDHLLADMFISHYLQPKNYINMQNLPEIPFSIDMINTLCDQAISILQKQPMTLQVRCPIKIFGDIHGQFSDLMRFFDLWGTPSDTLKDGDIESFDYLFLGDYVDRGNNSLETILILLALKVRYPEQIHLLRGNHEDRQINNTFGFMNECSLRINEDPEDDNSIFNKINDVFDWMPLAAVIEEKVICLHGGIGEQLKFVEDIDNLQRPLKVVHEVTTLEQQLVVDILWSDPTDSDQVNFQYKELGIIKNIVRDPGGTGNIVKFGPDRVQQFLKSNNLQLIIRAHECVMDGFERFAGGQLITLFSATDYCGQKLLFRKHKNAGAVLIIKTNMEIIPKLIYPQGVGNQNWMEDEESLKRRPPTPPRWKNNFQK